MRTFPVDALPDPLRAFVTGASRSIGCDLSFVALPLLSALAGAIGNARRIELKHGWSEPSVIWTAIVGESGTHKSPALELVLKPLRERQHSAMTEHRLAMKVYEADHARWKAQRRAWENGVAKGGSGDPPPEPERPVCERLIVDDLTTEALVARLQENQRGLLLVRDELSGWLGSFDRYTGGRGADAAKWIEVFGARALIVDRKGGETMFVPRASVSVCGGIQPGALRRALGQEHRENGLAARLLFAMPPRRARRWTEATVPVEIERGLYRVFAFLLALQPERGYDDEPEPVIVRLDPEAKAAFARFVDAHGEAGLDRTGEEASAWSKLEGYAARFALLLHLVRCAGGERIDPALVDGASVAAAVELVGWFGSEADRIYAMFNADDDDLERQQLLEWIDARGGSVSARDLTRGPSRFRKDPDAAEAALKELAEGGHGKYQIHLHGGGRGRPGWMFTRPGVGDGDGDGDENSENPGKTVFLSPSQLSPVSEHAREADGTLSPGTGNGG